MSVLFTWLKTNVEKGTKKERKELPYNERKLEASVCVFSLVSSGAKCLETRPRAIVISFGFFVCVTHLSSLFNGDMLQCTSHFSAKRKCLHPFITLNYIWV